MAQDDFIPFEGSEAGSSRPTPAPKGKDRVNTTVFISSLPYTATTTDVLTHFSFIGPVRHGFVATDKASGKSKGVGYVTYSLLEDAERAVNELDGGEFGDKGRKIRVQWAEHRPGVQERRIREVAAPKIARVMPDETASSEPVDPNAIRTLILSGLPSDLTKAVLWKKVRKTDDRVELQYPIEGEDNVAHLLFPSHSDAVKAAPKLHGHTYKGALLSCVLKKRLEKLSAKGDGKAPSHAGRLIVRNLPWDTTMEDLRATFLPHGPINSVDLPTAPSKLPPRKDGTPHPPRLRGFAFVWFLTRKDAEKAMEAVNGKTLSRAGNRKSQAKGEERVVAVDWALSKDKWLEAQKGEAGEEGQVKEGEGEEEDEDVEDESGEESQGDSEVDVDMEGSGSDEEAEDEDEDEEEQDGDEDEEQDEPVKPKLPTVDVGSTLFVRNLSFEAEEQELGELFRSFGPLRYARITIDRETGRSRGTGFVCFWKKEHADAAILEAERVAHETGANAQPLGSKNPFALPSVLTADPSSSLASRLVLHGRTLEVSRAVTREEAGQMKEDGERARHASDKRNTYLMREGVIFPNSPAAANLPPAELEKRQASFNARRAVLRSNPSLFISKTRLSIRQLPLFVTDRVLKRLAIHSIRAFDAEVKAGEREGLTRAEETDATLSAALAARHDKAKGNGKGKGKGGKERETAVIQSKVVRQAEKSDALTGMGKSKGYGFLELRSHKEALKVVRWANNNPEAGKLMWEWWKVEMGELLERTKKTLAQARDAKSTKVDETEGGGESKSDETQKQKHKPQESVEELESRVRKLESRLAEGDDRSEGGMRGGKTLIMEFSVENVQVVRRRVEKITTARQGDSQGQGPMGGSKRKAIAAEDSDDEGSAPTQRGKKPRVGDRDRGRGPQRGERGERGERSERGDRGGRGRPGFDRHGRGGNRGMGRRDSGKSDRPPRGPEGKAPAAQAVQEKRGLEKLGAQLGSLIGRKRKMRKGN